MQSGCSNIIIYLLCLQNIKDKKTSIGTDFKLSAEIWAQVYKLRMTK
jgi:hypothetical protein